jgi:hypothetical protein
VTDHLVLVREESVRVDELRPGDLIILQSGTRVEFERLDEYDEGVVPRWWRTAARGEPGHPGGKDKRFMTNGEYDGRYLGSLVLMQPSDTVRVDRG